MNTSSTLMADFLSFSSEVTAFTAFELVGTGQAEAYLEAVCSVVGEAPLLALTERWREVSSQTTAGSERDTLLRKQVFGDPWLGPIARNIVKMWYAATWYQLPTAWRESFGARPADVTFVVSATAYPEGLLWKAIGANPPGAKGPGYGTWADPPRIELG